MGSRNVTCLHIMRKMHIIFKRTLPWAQVSKDLDSEVYAGNTEDLTLLKWNEFENIFLLKFDIMRFDQEALRNRIIGLPPDQIKVKPNFEHVVLHFAWKDVISSSPKEEIKLWKIYVFLFICNDFTKYNRGISTARSLDFADVFFDKVLKLIGKEKDQNLAASNTFCYPISKHKGKLLKMQQMELPLSEKVQPFDLGESNVRLNEDSKLNLNPASNHEPSYDNLLLKEYKEMEKLFKGHHYKVRKVSVKFLKIFLKLLFKTVFEEICGSFVDVINKIKVGNLRVNDIYWNNTLREYIGSYYEKIPLDSEKIDRSKLDNFVNQDLEAFFKLRKNLERQVILTQEDDPDMEKPYYSKAEAYNTEKVWLTFDDISAFFNLFSYYTDPIKFYEKYSKFA